MAAKYAICPHLQRTGWMRTRRAKMMSAGTTDHSLHTSIEETQTCCVKYFLRYPRKKISIARRKLNGVHPAIIMVRGGSWWEENSITPKKHVMDAPPNVGERTERQCHSLPVSLYFFNLPFTFSFRACSSMSCLRSNVVWWTRPIIILQFHPHFIHQQTASFEELHQARQRAAKKHPF